MAERMDQRNTPTPAETIRIATRLKALGRDMDKAAGEVSRVRGEISGVWRDFKKMGGEKEVLREAIRLVEMDEDEARDYVKAVHEHAAILGRPLWTPSAADVAPGGLFNFDDEEPAPRIEPEPVRVSSDLGTTTFARGTWKAELTDLKALAQAVLDGKQPASFIMPNWPVINASIKGKQGIRECPGLRIFQEHTTGRRA